MNFNNILIASDLDGTLFSRNQTVPHRSAEAIEYFKKHGGHFTVSTGRDVNFIRRRFGFLIDLINAPAVLSNGARVFDFENNVDLFSSKLDTCALINLMKLIYEKFPDAPCEISSDMGYFIVNPNETFYKRFSGMSDLVLYGNKPVFSATDYFRVNIIDKNLERINKVADLILSTGYNEYFDFVFSESFIFEILPKGANKAHGISVVRSSVPTVKKVIAVGDYYNDIALLQTADLPLCPSNAHPDVKKICKFVLCDCDDGVLADIVEGIEHNRFDI